MGYTEMYRDVFNFHKKYRVVKDDEAYWRAIIKESGMIMEKYGGCDFINSLVVAVVDELERKYKADAGRRL